MKKIVLSMLQKLFTYLKFPAILWSHHDAGGTVQLSTENGKWKYPGQKEKRRRKNTADITKRKEEQGK